MAGGKDVEDPKHRVRRLETKVRMLEAERDRLERILSSLATGLAVVNPDRTIAWVNGKTREMFPGEDPVGRVCRPPCEACGDECDPCPTLACFRSGEVHAADRRNPADGRWYRIVSRPIKDPAGRVAQVLEGVTDITERKNADVARHERREQLRLVADNLPGGFVYQYTQNEHGGQFLFVSSGVENVFPGLRSRDVLNDAAVLLNLIDPDQLAGFQEAVESSARSMTDFSMDVRQRRSDGEPRWFHVHSRPRKTPAGRIVWDGVVSDISDRKRAEEALRRSEQRFRALVEASSEVLYRMSPDWAEVRHSRDGGSLTAAGEPDPNWFQRYVHPDDQPAVSREIRRAIRDKSAFASEHRVRRADGTPGWVRSRAVPVLSEKGDIVEWFGAAGDVTEQKLAEQQLRDSERRYRRILHTTTDGFHRADRRGRILEANAAYSRMSGYDIPELLSLSIADVEASMDSGEIASWMKRIVADGNARFESRHRRKDGSVYDVEVSVQTREENGEIEFVSFIRDISRRKSREKVQAAKLRLIDFSSAHSTREFLRTFLDEAEALTGSEIGFFHFVEPDQEMLSLQTWSTNTLKNRCAAEGSGLHYPIREAGVWVDCVRALEPVIHNDYESLPRKKGMPAGHPRLTRELVVPVIRQGTIVAVFGVGNKKAPYDANDVDIVQQLADLSWETVMSRRAEEDLRESEEKYRSMMEAMTDGAYICSAEHRLTYLNPAMIRLLGRDARGEACHAAVHGFDQPCPWCSMGNVQRGEAIEIDIQSPRDQKHYHVSNSPLFHRDGSVSQMAIVRDLTQVKMAEQQIRQSQKLESIGSLAGGIAHDFNNILFPIVGLSEMLLEDFPPDSPEYENVLEIYKAGKRGGDLVKQILSFGRQSEQKRVPVHIQQILKEVLKLSRSTIPVDIAIRWDIQKDCRMVLADPVQIHQIAMNLVTNAYHAVEAGGGTIAVRLGEVDVGPVPFSESGLAPGRYAVLSVSDTGVGIDPAVMDKIFEPYFTTKGKDKGTGLGLAVVYGIVKEHHGDIRVTSDIGKGAAFDVYLPVMEDDETLLPAKERGADPSGSERILLVDDEAPIARLLKQILERLGYRVTVRLNSLEALEAFRSGPGAFDLIVSDMTMPNMTGDLLAREAIAVRPDIPVIICTGFSERLNRERAARIGVKGLLMKPVVKAELSRMVRRVLDGKAG